MVIGVDESVEQFYALLRTASAELHADNPGAMSTPDLLPTSNVIAPDDVALFWVGVDRGLIRLARGGKFNTFDRPVASGRWSLLSRSKRGGWYNAEYLPQLASYVDAIVTLGYPKDRVLFELPPSALQLDLAILDDTGHVIVLGEAKRQAGMLPKLVQAMTERFASAAPTDESKRRGDEARQLAWRLWTVRPRLCWLIGPGERVAYRCSYAPLELTPIGRLPDAHELALDHRPPRPLLPPRLL
jgi:hypothetical protein